MNAECLVAASVMLAVALFPEFSLGTEAGLVPSNINEKIKTHEILAGNNSNARRETGSVCPLRKKVYQLVKSNFEVPASKINDRMRLPQYPNKEVWNTWSLLRDTGKTYALSLDDLDASPQTVGALLRILSTDGGCNVSDAKRQEVRCKSFDRLTEQVIRQVQMSFHKRSNEVSMSTYFRDLKGDKFAMLDLVMSLDYIFHVGDTEFLPSHTAGYAAQEIWRRYGCQQLPDPKLAPS